MLRLSTGFLLLMLFPFCAVAGEPPFPVEEPKVPVEVFYSKDDPRWKDTERAIEDVAAALKRLHITKYAIDDDAGYQKLLNAERERPNMVTGDITIVIGPYTLTNKGDRKDIEMYFGPMMHRFLNPNVGKGRRNVDLAGIAGATFGKGAKLEAFAIDPKNRDPILDAIFYRVMLDGKQAGWLADVFWPIPCPVCNDTQFAVSIALKDHKIIDVHPIRELERNGRMLETKESEPFLNQFKGVTDKAGVAKVDVISGATKTSHSYQAALNKTIEALIRHEQNK
ncbi:MAG TPA: FMN-binding protein [Planctomycetota bacterium]|nr:FMN-binding protein [Planctomycetota bacterium]